MRVHLKNLVVWEIHHNFFQSYFLVFFLSTGTSVVHDEHHWCDHQWTKALDLLHQKQLRELIMQAFAK
jgi:hypothetical protein